MNDTQLPVHVPAPAQPPVKSTAERWRLIRDLVVFQIKLLVDGIKDLVLGPLSFVAAMLDLISGTPRNDGLFAGVLRAGARFDRWVALYDAANEPGLDEYLRRLEHLIVTQHQSGGITAEAKQAVDRAIDLLDGQFKPRD